MSSRMGTSADVVLGTSAMASILEAAERSGSPGGLSGIIDSDGRGDYRVVTGTGRTDVGMYFPAEGTEATECIIDTFRKECGEGILVVIDPEIAELAMYIVDDKVCRIASGLMAE